MSIITTAKGDLEIRELHGIHDMLAAEDIQIKVWGQIIPNPKELLIPIQHEGGLLAGAFTSSGEMASFVFGFPTREPAAMHSQMLATLPAWRGLGIGTHLKWFQRQWCLEHGITCLRWTVDPLRAANAELNIRHLGGTAARYYQDYYGAMQGIDAGVPTDRLLVEWALDAPRVARRAQERPADRGFPNAAQANASVEGRPVQPDETLRSPALLIRLPDDFIQLSQTDPELALAWRLQTRALMLHYFAQGYRITEFTRVGGPAYLLEQGESGGH